jgi:hypothetical protein
VKAPHFTTGATEKTSTEDEQMSIAAIIGEGIDRRQHLAPRRTSMDVRWDDQLSSVTASLNYLQPAGKRPVSYTYEPPPGVPWRSGEYVSHQVPIRDARPAAGRMSLDTHGFAIAWAASAVRGFYDGDRIRRDYYPETEQLLAAVTGAERVVAFDHNVRNAFRAASGQAAVKEPVKRVHNDFTALSGPQRAAAELSARGEDPAILERRRFALVNLWRPISGPVEESPLAVCDASTMELGDFVPTDLVYRDRIGEVYSVAYSPRHRWFYVPRMRTDEALLLKCFDSATDGRPRFTAHTAFDDPTSGPDAAPRESIEVRTLVLYPG